MKDFFFPLKPFPILNPMTGIETCDAGILSNPAWFASVPLEALPASARSCQADPCGQDKEQENVMSILLSCLITNND
jgi:hypothetical protein